MSPANRSLQLELCVCKPHLWLQRLLSGSEHYVFPSHLTAGGLDILLVAVHLVCGLLFRPFYLAKLYQDI